MMTESAMISFVVIAYNEERNIADTLKAIAELDGLGRYEIIVVNDGSADATAQIVSGAAAENRRIRLIDLTENRGRGNARHTGVRAAQGDLIATVDADIVLPTDWLTRTRDALTQHDAVGGIAVPDGDVQYLYSRFDLSPRVVSATNDVTGNNGLYRRGVFDLVEFDPELREGEDSALNHAMKLHGMSFVTIPELLVRHRESKNFSTSLKWLFEVGKGATRQLAAYHEVRQPDIATFAFVVAIIAGAFVAAAATWFGILLPITLVLIIAVQHVRSRFETPPGHWPRLALAVAADCTMLTAYFSGRLVGVFAVVLNHNKRRMASPAYSRSLIAGSGQGTGGADEVDSMTGS